MTDLEQEAITAVRHQVTTMRQIFTRVLKDGSVSLEDLERVQTADKVMASAAAILAVDASAD